MIATTIITLQGIIVVPILTRSLEKAEYGTWSLFTTILSLVGLVVLFNADGGLARFLPTVGVTDRGRVLASLGGPPVLAAALIGAILILLAAPIARLSALPQTAVAMMGVMLPIEVGMWVAFGYMRGSHRFRTYALARGVAAAVFLGSTFAVARSRPSIEAFLVCYAAGEATVLGVLAGVLTRDRVRLMFEPDRARAFVRFALPLLPNSLLYWIVESSDRYILGVFRTLPEVAEYALAYTIGGTLLMIWSPVGMLIIPQAARMWEAGEQEKLARMMRLLIRAAIVVGAGAAMGLMGLAPELLLFLATPAYLSGSAIVGVIAIAYLFFLLASAYQSVLYLDGRTRTITVAFIACAAANLVLNLIFVPRFGTIAAASSTLVAYGLFCAVLRAPARRIMKLGDELSTMLRVAPAAGSLYLFLDRLPVDGILKIVVGVPAGLMLFGAVAWATGALRFRHLRELASLMGWSAPTAAQGTDRE